MKRPAFQFYAGDWLRNAKLRRCSPAARGVWMDVMCLLHDSDEYGVVRWPLKDIAQASGAPLKLLRELAEKGVLKGAEKDAAPYVWQPTHAGKTGEPVTLVTHNGGPVWYCSRFVRDEEKRRRRGKDSRFDDGENQPQKTKPKPPPMEPPKPPFGGGSGDGSASASAFAFKTHTPPDGAGDEFDAPSQDHWQPDPERLKAQLHFAGVPMPSDESLRQILATFNPQYASLPEDKRFGKLVQWLIGDHRNGKSQAAGRSGPTGSAAGPSPGQPTARQRVEERQRQRLGS